MISINNHHNWVYNRLILVRSLLLYTSSLISTKYEGISLVMLPFSLEIVGKVMYTFEISQNQLFFKTSSLLNSFDRKFLNLIN